jgi:phosphatidylethanolamine/phosphatidyl-N-methylethanolamine N-methyltransferase
MSTASTSTLYGRHAAFYDLVFGLSLGPGRLQTLQRMAVQPGENVLEIGVGTGLSLSLYPPGTHLTGIDLSSQMLAQAQTRAAEKGIPIDLFQMNAQQLEFKDNSFDKCVAMYVASVTPHPSEMVAEMKRVTKPGGHFYILNHFSRKGSWLTFFEKLLSSQAALIGFEPLFYLDDFIAATQLENPIDIPIRPLGYWRLLEVKNLK